MEGSIVSVAYALQDCIVFFINEYTIFIRTILAYGIPFIVLLISFKYTDVYNMSAAHKNVEKSLHAYYCIVNFLFIPSMIIFIVDCITVWCIMHDTSILILALPVLIYIIAIYKSLFMLIAFKKHALVYTHIFLFTFPFVVSFWGHKLWPFDVLLISPQDPFAVMHDDSYLCILLGAFSLRYILFFAFSKRVHAAWAAPGLDDAVRAEPQI